MKSLLYKGSAGAVFCVKKAADMLPWPTAVALGAFLGRAAFSLPSRQRRVALANLEAALGPSGRRGYSGIASEAFENLGKGLCEVLASGKLSRREIDRLVSVRGEENLIKASSAGRGVIGVSAHLGNFTFIGIKLAMRGHRFNYVFRYPNLDFLAGAVRMLGEHHKVGFIPALPRKEAARQSVKSLRKNEIVCILADQNEMHGMEVDFFSRPAATAAGPVVLAMRTGAAIVPMFALRDAKDNHTVAIEPEFKLALTGSYAFDVRSNTQRLNRVIEGYVRRYPGQWWWMHRRWRS